MLALTALAILLMCAVGLGEAKWPKSSSSGAKTNGKMKVDTGNSSEGYFLASVSSKSKRKLKLRVVKGKETLTYDLNNSGKYEVFPFQLGSGKYEISLWENVSGKKYSPAGSLSIKVNMKDTEACFYYPNQMVNYTKKTDAVSEAEKLCKGKKKDQDKYDLVCNYMKKNFVYDYMKAFNVTTGMLPDIEEAWKKHMGICQDLSAIMCCMLRTQGLPARLMIGNADKTYHAWVVVNFGGKEHFFDPTAAVNGISKVKKYTLERYY